MPITSRKSILAAACIAILGSTHAMAQQPSAVVELANRWTAAYNQGNAEDIANLYSQGAELYIHKEGRFVGRGNIRTYWAGDLTRSNPMTVLTVTDSVVDDEMMLVHGNYQVLDRTTGVPLGAGRFAHIWVKGTNGLWALDRDVWVDRSQ